MITPPPLLTFGRFIYLATVCNQSENSLEIGIKNCLKSVSKRPAAVFRVDAIDLQSTLSPKMMV